MNFDPKVFGEGFHEFVQLEVHRFGNSLGIVFHIITLVILFLVFRYGNKYKRFYAIYFTCNWIFLFGYWGLYAITYWWNIGGSYLAIYSLTPILLCLITIYWIKEVINPRIDWSYYGVKKYRFLILIITLWGYWYPTYIYGQGFIFEVKDFLFSNYGLMPCPTTMAVLSLMTLNYPSGNKHLYHLFTVYALFIGTASVLAGWLPDIPFIVLGVYSLILMLQYRWKMKLNA
jgi:hypothetical protein